MYLIFAKKQGITLFTHWEVVTSGWVGWAKKNSILIILNSVSHSVPFRWALVKLVLPRWFTWIYLNCFVHS